MLIPASPLAPRAVLSPPSEMPRACDDDGGDEDYVELLQREIAHLGLAGPRPSTMGSNSHGPKGGPILNLLSSGGSLGGGGLSPYELARAAAAAAASASAPGSAAASPPASPAAHSASASASASASPRDGGRSTKGASKASKAGKAKGTGGSTRRAPPQSTPLQSAQSVPSPQMFYLEELEVDSKRGLKSGSKGALRGKSKSAADTGTDAAGTPRGGLRARRQQLQARRRERSQSVDLTSRGRGDRDRFDDLLGMAMGQHCLKPTMISLPNPQDSGSSPSTPTAAAASASAGSSPSATPASTPGAPRPGREKPKKVWGEPRLVSAGSHPKAALESTLQEEALASRGPAVASRRERRRGRSQESFPDPIDCYFEGDSLAGCLMTSGGGGRAGGRQREGEMQGEMERGAKRDYPAADSMNAFRRGPPPPDAHREEGESAPVDRRQLPGSRAQKATGASADAVGPTADRQSPSLAPRRVVQPHKEQLLEPSAAPEYSFAVSRDLLSGSSEGEAEFDSQRTWVVDPLAAHGACITYDGLQEPADRASLGCLSAEGVEYAHDSTAECEDGHNHGGAAEENEEEMIDYEDEEIEYEDEEIEYEEHSDASPRAENEWEAAERREIEQRDLAGTRGQEVEGGVNLVEQLQRARMSYDCGTPSALLRVAIFNRIAKTSSGMTDDMCPTP